MTQDISTILPFLKLYLDKGKNVKIEGRRGTGKTSVINKLFTKKFGPQGERWRSFSGGTMDPFLELIGVPIKREVNGELTLEYIRPKDLNEEILEALFIDEYNRSPQSVRNALMELCQFKSINGRKFPKLQVVWCAINPADCAEEEYQVEPLDPAQEERFQASIEFPFVPCKSYFVKKHATYGLKAITWWDSLSAQHKNLVSPRVLDQAVEIFRIGGDICHVIRKFDPSTLKDYLGEVEIEELLHNNLTSSEEDAKKFINHPNTFNKAIKTIGGSRKYVDFYGPLLLDEFKNKLANISGYAKNLLIPQKEQETILVEERMGSLVGGARVFTEKDYPFSIIANDTYNRIQKLGTIEIVFNNNLDNVSYAKQATNFLYSFLQRSQKSTVIKQANKIESIIYKSGAVGDNGLNTQLTRISNLSIMRRAGIKIDTTKFKAEQVKQDPYTKINLDEFVNKDFTGLEINTYQ